MGVAVRVIPCLDVAEGRVVKGVNFTGLRDAGDPVELAKRYDAQGADEPAYEAQALEVLLPVGGLPRIESLARRQQGLPQVVLDRRHGGARLLRQF